MATYILPFSQMVLTDIPKVGGKNASLGEMITTLASKNINVPEGFALTADAYWLFITQNSLKEKLTSVLATLDTKELSNLHEVGEACRKLVSGAELPGAIKQELLDAYHRMSGTEEMSVAVRSSATAEDLPTASFAGQHDSFLNIKGDKALQEAVHKCYVSLFNDRAIKYRVDNGFEHMDVALSIGIQRMVRSDKASAGVAFTIEPESGNQNLVYITGAWGLGEAVVQGAVNPDEYYFFKPAIENGKESMVSRRLGAKKNMMVYSDVAAEVPVKTIATAPEQQARFTLTREEAAQLAAWCYDIEQHYRQPMDIEWAKDGLDNKLYILQARPETVHGREQKLVIKEYKIKTDAEPLCKG
ncbi:MAG: phosphoenolpyruvate synthase, partial [Taibaiella sp.]|nr:phosphoenolpyruvate synthase [Taibaiella sp.]